MANDTRVISSLSFSRSLCTASTRGPAAYARGVDTEATSCTGKGRGGRHARGAAGHAEHHRSRRGERAVLAGTLALCPDGPRGVLPGEGGIDPGGEEGLHRV